MHKKEEGFTGTQVVTEYDAICAMYDYIALQLNGRFRVQFPEYEENISVFVESLYDKETRAQGEGHMKFALAQTTTDMFAPLLICGIDGCHNETAHAFRKEFIDLVLNARQQTAEWLKGQGIVPGQSTN